MTIAVEFVSIARVPACPMEDAEVLVQRDVHMFLLYSAWLWTIGNPDTSLHSWTTGEGS
jgi:hypothetical protein